MRLTFHGGAKSVTGANHLLEIGSLKILIDCGLFQGSLYSEELNYRPFSYHPTDINYVLITHSHVDHMGRIPKLYRDGFRGSIITTEPTAAITEVALPDTLDKILEEARLMGHEPLYNKDDYAGAMSLFKTVRYGEPVKLDDNTTVIFHEASHILGSAIIEILARENDQIKKIVFTGDLGNPPTILLNPIDYVHEADYAVVESAYGDRVHEARDQRQAKLRQVILETIQRGGVLMIPSFAVERTQELLLELDELIKNKQIPQIPIFVDSPLAINITKVYGKFSHYFNPIAAHILQDHGGLFNFSWLKFTPSSKESKRINDTPAPKIIIAGSGMSTGGRILHHESRYLSGDKNTILFIGYQVAGSLGRRILEGEKEVKIFGQNISVNCRIESIPAYSAHADQNGLIKFVQEANQGGKLKRVFVVQGEEAAAETLAAKIKNEIGVSALAPDLGQSENL